LIKSEFIELLNRSLPIRDYFSSKKILTNLSLITITKIISNRHFYVQGNIKPSKEYKKYARRAFEAAWRDRDFFNKWAQELINRLKEIELDKG